MAATPEQLKKARKKAILSERNGKHGPRKSTIAKENARVFYELKVLEKLGAITNVQLKSVLKEKNVAERIEVIRQLIGKPLESLDLGVTGSIELKQIQSDTKKLADAISKAMKPK